MISEITAGTHWIGGWMNPRSGSDAVEKRKKIPPLLLAGTESPVAQLKAQSLY
jgi:hypothetical protein